MIKRIGVPQASYSIIVYSLCGSTDRVTQTRQLISSDDMLNLAYLTSYNPLFSTQYLSAFYRQDPDKAQEGSWNLLFSYRPE